MIVWNKFCANIKKKFTSYGLWHANPSQILNLLIILIAPPLICREKTRDN